MNEKTHRCGLCVSFTVSRPKMPLGWTRSRGLMSHVPFPQSQTGASFVRWPPTST